MPLGTSRAWRPSEPTWLTSAPLPQVTNVAWESSQVILPGQRLSFAKAVENWLCSGSPNGVIDVEH